MDRFPTFDRMIRTLKKEWATAALFFAVYRIKVGAWRSNKEEKKAFIIKTFRTRAASIG